MKATEREKKTAIQVFTFEVNASDWEIIAEQPLEQASDTAPQSLHITVANGDMMFSSWPVMIGHFEYDGLFSAERVANKYLDNALARDHKLDIYPGPVGSSKLFRQELDNPFKGALIVGMGSAERLNAFQLALSVEKAVSNYLLELPVTDDSGRRGISTLLMGGDYGGLSLENSCRAILQGIHNANQKVIAMDTPDRLLISHVEFLEIYEDRAINAFYVLDRLINGNSDGLPLQQAEKGLRILPGVLRRLISDNSTSWWQRLSVQATTNDCQPGEKRFSFYSSTNNAREEKQSIYTRLSDIDNLLDEVSRQRKWSFEKARTIFEMTIPNAFKESIRRNSPIIWVLDPATAGIPWELLQTGNRDELPLCVSAGMIRQLSTSFYTPVTNAVQSNKVLLIADPDMQHAPDISPLPGAVNEIIAVHRSLSSLQELDITGPLINSHASDIQIAFFSEHYKIIHFAGHGVFNPTDPMHTGLVIGFNEETNTPVLFTPARFRQFSNAPELVFINACYSGSLDQEAEELAMSRHKLAANIGTQLINLGVKAVVIAGWEVDDAAAGRFAKVFYEKMAVGQTFGDAIHAARVVTHREFPGTNTWGAYQCYGQPHYTITNSSGGSRKLQLYQLPQEAENDLNNLLSSIDIAFRSDAELLSELQGISARIARSGFRQPELLEKEAQAYLGLDEAEQALQLYQQIFDTGADDFRIRSLEKYQDISIKHAVNLLRLQRDSGERDELADSAHRKTIDQSLQNLLSLYHFHRSGRLSLMIASAYKRLAYITVGLQRLKYLILCRDEYRAAFELLRSAYALQNWLSAELLLHFAAAKGAEKKYLQQQQINYYAERDELKNAFLQLLRNAQRRMASQRRKVTFYDEADVLDLRLAEYLLRADDYKKSRGDYLRGMNLLWRKSVSKNKKARQLDNLRIFRSMLEAYDQQRFADKIAQMELQIADNFRS